MIIIIRHICNNSSNFFLFFEFNVFFFSSLLFFFVSLVTHFTQCFFSSSSSSFLLLLLLFSLYFVWYLVKQNKTHFLRLNNHRPDGRMYQLECDFIYIFNFLSFQLRLKSTLIEDYICISISMCMCAYFVSFLTYVDHLWCIEKSNKEIDIQLWFLFFCYSRLGERVSIAVFFYSVKFNKQEEEKEKTTNETIHT